MNSEAQAPYISIIIPAYNEERRLPNTLNDVLKFMRAQSWTSEVIVVDDGSEDGTSDVALSFARRNASVRVLRYTPNRGKGYAVNRGMMASRGRFALFSDADLSTPIEELTKLLLPLERGECDIAIASRALPESELAIRQPFFREMLGRTFNVFVQALLLPGIHDTQCGFKCFRREVIHEIFARQRIFGFAFDVEILFIARSLGYRIREMPVRWINSPETKVKLLKHGPQMLWQLMQIRWNAWWRVYSYEADAILHITPMELRPSSSNCDGLEAECNRNS